MKPTQKKSLRAAFALTLAALALFASGCASIVHGGSRTITVNSTPAGAKVTISKSDTLEAVHTGTTPLTVSLDPKRGYFKGQAYTIKFELPGYRTSELRLEPTLTNWYFGNILVGGLIGMVVVDPLTGSMWNLSPDKISHTLEASQAAALRQKNSFMIVLRSDLSESEQRQLVRIN